jgi:Mg2+ and Co2+ transporter CorA
VRVVSTVSVTAIELQEDESDPTKSKAGELRFQQVEFLASERCLVTCWQGDSPVRPEDLFETVAGTWEHGGYASVGDLGLLILYEMAQTYTKARRELYAWLETWELDFFRRREHTETRTLEELRIAIAGFRRHLTEFHRSGLADHPERIWFTGVTQPEEAERVDDLIDRALSDLRALSEALIASISLASTIQTAAESRRNEIFQPWVAAGAAVLLVPTLIASVYGANTPLPLADEWWGFGVMVSLVFASAVATWFIISRLSSDTGPRQTNDVRIEPHPAAVVTKTALAQSSRRSDFDTTEPVVILYEHVARDDASKSPVLLRIFAEHDLLKPEQIGELLAPANGNVPLTKHGARAVLRNLGRAQTHLRAAGGLERDVIEKDFTRYDDEGSGRYGLTEADRKVLKIHLTTSERTDQGADNSMASSN